MALGYLVFANMLHILYNTKVIQNTLILPINKHVIAKMLQGITI